MYNNCPNDIEIDPSIPFPDTPVRTHRFHLAGSRGSIDSDEGPLNADVLESLWIRLMDLPNYDVQQNRSMLGLELKA
jgi:hypothetical protein